MLQTIEVNIDAAGSIHLLEPLPFKLVGRALLTLLKPDADASLPGDSQRATAAATVALLETQEFRDLPAIDPTETQRRIVELRDGWNDN